MADEAGPLVDRGREAAESLAREAAERVPSRSRRRRRRRGAIALVLLGIAAGVALYFAWQRRGHEPARLIFEPEGPDVAPPPPPEPARPSVEEVQPEPTIAMSAELVMDEEADGESASPPGAAPEVQPLTAGTGREMPVATTPIIEATAAPLVSSWRAPELEDEPTGVELEDEPTGVEIEDELIEPASDLEAVPEADEPAATEATTETGDEPAATDEPVAERTAPWLEPAVSETPLPEPPERAAETERSMPLRAPASGSSSLPPSSPAGAPFRAAGDGLPGGRSWPTLPR